MKKVASFFSNTILATLLLVLILLPVGIVGSIGGVGSKPQKGVALGAKLNEQGGTFSEMKTGEIKEISFTTFWGNLASYQNILSVRNVSASKKEYQLEVLELRGVETEKQDVLVYFRETGTPKITLEPEEVARVNLNVTTPETSGALRTQTTLNLVIWEH